MQNRGSGKASGSKGVEVGAFGLKPHWFRELLLSCDAQNLTLEMGCLHPSCNTDQGVKQTRKGEDFTQVPSLVLKGRPQGQWCAHKTNAQHRPASTEVEIECACLDPKGGELCLNKMKPGETQVEVCSDADVQIARMIWVSERKTHRTT